MGRKKASYEALKSHRFFRYILRAIEEHPHYQGCASLHAAGLVKGGNLLLVKTNSPRTHGLITTYEAWPGMQVHAECHVILRGRIKHDLRGARIYVARVMKENGSLGNSKPCNMCVRVMIRYGIRRVYFTQEDGYSWANPETLPH